jgi:hypothetical protein
LAEIGEDRRSVSIRAKLYAAIVMTVIGPVVTIAVALSAMARLDDRFTDVEQRAARQSLALELKFGVTDLNGWQTAYGYDDGESRPQFVRSRAALERDLARAKRTMTDPRERAILARLEVGLRRFLALDDVAYAALQDGRTERVRQIFLGPEITQFQAMAGAAADLAAYEETQADATRRAFDDEHRDARRQLVAVGLGAGVLIVLLLLTAQDVARAALERRGEAGAATAPPTAPPPD